MASCHTFQGLQGISSFTQAKVYTLVQCFQKGQSASKPHNKSNNNCNLCAEKGNWANDPNMTHFTMKPHSDNAKPNGCSLGPSRHPGCGNPCENHRHSQEGQGEPQANKQSWKNIPPIGMGSTKLVNGSTFHWCSKCMPPQWSTTHLMVMHTDYSTTSKQNTNAHLLDFNAAPWVIDLPIQNLNLTFMKAPLQASSPRPVFQTLMCSNTRSQHLAWRQGGHCNFIFPYYLLQYPCSAPGIPA